MHVTWISLVKLTRLAASRATTTVALVGMVGEYVNLNRPFLFSISITCDTAFRHSLLINNSHIWLIKKKERQKTGYVAMGQ